MQDACSFDIVVVFAIPKVLGLKPRHIAGVIFLPRCCDIDAVSIVDGAAAIRVAHLGLARMAAVTKGGKRGTAVSAAAAGRAAAGGRIIDGGEHRFGVVVDCDGFVTCDGYKNNAILAL